MQLPGQNNYSPEQSPELTRIWPSTRRTVHLVQTYSGVPGKVPGIHVRKPAGRRGMSPPAVESICVELRGMTQEAWKPPVSDLLELKPPLFLCQHWLCHSRPAAQGALLEIWVSSELFDGRPYRVTDSDPRFSVTQQSMDDIFKLYLCIYPKQLKVDICQLWITSGLVSSSVTCSVAGFKPSFQANSMPGKQARNEHKHKFYLKFSITGSVRLK